MEITWKYIKPLKDSMVISNYLKSNSIILPNELTRLLEMYNGGRPSEKTIVTATNQEYVFKSLLSFNKNDKETIYTIYPRLFKHRDLFPFASDSAGNFVCYDLSSKQYILYNHETGQEEKIVQMPAIL